jgi:hypothetical protein
LEITIHVYLEAFAVRGEWFRDGDRPQQLIAWMSLEDGLAKFQAAFLKGRKPMWFEPAKPRRRGPPISMEVDDKANERYERIKQRTLAKQAAKRSQEAAQ